jgi:hypothetical protein
MAKQRARKRNTLQKNQPDDRSRALPLLRKLEFPVRILLFFYSACMGFPIRYHIAATDLDASAAVALNYAHTHGIIHGRDIGFTYGPLCYLILPMPFGSNLQWGILFQLFFWVAFIAMLGWIVFFKRVPLINLLIAALCLFTGSRMYTNFGYAGPDFFLIFFALLLVAATAVTRRWYVFWICAVVLSALLLLVKLSTGISAISAVLLFPIAVFTVDRGKSVKLLSLAVMGVPLFFVTGYLLYQPSFADLARYLKAGFEISAGHSTAMSLPGSDTALVTALLLMAAFLFLCGALYFTRQLAFCTAVACLGPLFLEFKHTFIRESGHVEILFTFVPLALAAVILFADLGRNPKFLIPGALALISGLWLIQERPFYQWSELPTAPLSKLRELARMLDFTGLRNSLEQISTQNLEGRRLPASLLNRVSNRSVTIIPWECSYAAANAIRYAPLPTLQSLTAYTTYLDGWTASMLEGQRAPEFVIFEWQSLDGRHPLLDIPQATFALYRNYEWDATYGPIILLRKRAQPLDASTRLVRTAEVHIGQPLMLQPDNHPLIVRLFLKFNSLGWFRNLFFRIPEVRGILGSEGSRFITARVPPLVMPGGVPVNLIPTDLSEFQSLFRDNTLNEPMTSIVISGEGSSYFADPVHAEVYESPGISLNFRPTQLPNLEALGARGVLEDSRIEVLNNSGVIGISEREIVEVKAAGGYLGVRGWAVNASAVLVQLDGKLYPATYGLPRQDIAILYRTPQAANAGFEWAFPSWKLGSTTHEIALKMLSTDKTGYYDSPRKVRFRIVQ